MKVVGIARAAEVVLLDAVEKLLNGGQTRQPKALAAIELGDVFEGDAREMRADQFLQGGQ